MSALRLTGDPKGRWEVENAHVEVTLTGVPVAEVRRFVAGLDELIAAGRETVDAEVMSAIETDAERLALRDREAEIVKALTGHLQSLIAAHERRKVARANVETALRKGGDYETAERDEAEAAAEIARLERRREVTQDELERVRARVRGREDRIAREVRARILADAQSEMDALAAEVAAAVFGKLRRLNELRGLVGETDPHR